MGEVDMTAEDDDDDDELFAFDRLAVVAIIVADDDELAANGLMRVTDTTDALTAAPHSTARRFRLALPKRVLRNRLGA